MGEQRIGANLLQLRWNVPPDRIADFADWYDQEHLADMAAVPGVLGGRRFVRVATDFSSPSDFSFLTLYQLADLSAFETAEFEALATDPSPWTRRVAFDLEMARTVYLQLHPYDQQERHPAGRALLHVMMSPGDAPEADFHAWYDEEHLPALAAVPGVLGARRFRKVDDGAEFGLHEAQAGYDYLAVYELEDVAVADTAEFREAGMPTERRRSLGTSVRAHVQVYAQEYPKDGAFEGGRA